MERLNQSPKKVRTKQLHEIGSQIRMTVIEVKQLIERMREGKGLSRSSSFSKTAFPFLSSPNH